MTPRLDSVPLCIGMMLDGLLDTERLGLMTGLLAVARWFEG